MFMRISSVFVLLFLIGAAAVLADENSEIESKLIIPNQSTIKSIHSSQSYDNTSFLYEHFFDDGSVISAQGEFKYWHGKAYAIGAGFIRMNIQRKIYEFKYDDDGTFIRGVLSFKDSNGTTIMEQYNASKYLTCENSTEYPGELVFNTDSPNRLDSSDVKMHWRFPRSENHPSFSCEFHEAFPLASPQFKWKLFGDISFTSVCNDISTDEGYTSDADEFIAWRLTIPDPNTSKFIKSYHKYDNASYAYRYYFDDGSIASEVGRIKVNGNITHRFGAGYFRFNIDGRMHEFQYDVDDDGVRGLLSFVSPNGIDILQENFTKAHSEDTRNQLFDLYNPPGDFQITLNPFDHHDFGDIKMIFRFPLRDDFPSFSCKFSTQSEPTFNCHTSIINITLPYVNELNPKCIVGDHQYDHTRYVFRYLFEDGAIASEAGILIFNSDGTHMVGKGYFRMNIRRNIYELNYNIDEDNLFGILTFVAPNGSIIEESYRTSIRSPFDVEQTGNFQFHRNSNGFFTEFAWIIFKIPSNENHVPFSCEFKTSKLTQTLNLRCHTMENRTEEVIAFTPNEADESWLDERRRSQIETLSFENHYDENGQYKIDYIFDTGVEIHEVGKLNENGTLSHVEGFILIGRKDGNYEFNYTGDANGILNNVEYAIFDADNTVKHRSDMKTVFEIYRELTSINGTAFVKGKIIIDIEYFCRPSTVFINIDEMHSYGELKQCEPGVAYGGVIPALLISAVGR